MNDIKFAFRQLGRKPGFTLMVVFTLALGIGATTAIFSIVNAALLRPLPFKDPERLVRIYTEFPGFANGGLRRFPFSAPELLEFRQAAKSWESVEGYITTGINFSSDAQPVRATVCVVTGGLLNQLGVPPMAGRVIQPSDDVPGAQPAIVLSYNFWRRAFGANTNVVGKEITIEGQKATVVGIMPRLFNFPIDQNAEIEAWSAMRIDPTDQNRSNHSIQVIGRLAPGIPLAQAQGEIAAIVKRATETGAGRHNFHEEHHPLVSYAYHDEIVRNIKPALKMLFGAVCFVLLISCVNVGNLLLARAEHRQREIAIRSAIGAGFWRLIRQFITEGIALSLLGALAGLFLAYHGLEFAKLAVGSNLPRAGELNIDLNVCLFALGLSVLSGTLFGLTPIAHVLTGKEYLALKSASASTTGSIRSQRFQQSLVVAEMALALMLLVGAGLMLKAFWLLQRVDGGFEPRGVITASVSMPRNPSVTNAAEAWIRLEQKLRELPGVESIGIATGLPPIYDPSFNDTQIEGFVAGPGSRPQNVDFFQSVSPGYFAALSMRLVEGRFLDARDTAEAPQVCVINQTMARAFWGNKSALGRRVRPGNNGEWANIVGVIEDAKNAGLERPSGTEIYLPLTQRPSYGRSTRFIVAKTRGDLFSLANTIRATVRTVAPDAPVSRVRSMDEVVASARSKPRFLTQLLTIFSGTALVLASVGIYGVISYSVAKRTREFGVRMALGATTADVLRLVLRRGVFLTLGGLLIGLVGSIALTRFLSTLLFGVSPTDSVTFLTVPLVLAAVAILASYFPARRATRVDPLQALRYE